MTENVDGKVVTNVMEQYSERVAEHGVDSIAEQEIAYVLKGFPRLSEPFISNEIYLLEQMGLRLRLFSIKPGDQPVHETAAKIQAPVSYVPEVPPVSDCKLSVWLYQNFAKFRSSHWRLLRLNPLRYLMTLAAALRMYWRYRKGRFSRPKKAIIKEFLQAGYIADALTRYPRVRHLHGHFCHEATTVTWFVSRLTGHPFSFTAHAKDIYQTKLNPRDLLEVKLNSAQFVVTCTETNVDYLTAKYPAACLVKRIYHGLDTDYFKPPERSAGLGQEKPLILAVGRFVEKKGFHYLIEACGLLKAAKLDFQCEIYGEPGSESQRISSLVEELGLREVVTLQGAVPQQQLREAYLRATLFALPCQLVEDGDRDGIPNVLVEAMAMGVPVVSTQVSGIPELVKNDVNGLLVPQRDSRAMAQALRRLLEHPELRRTLSCAGRDTVCRSFDSHQTTLELKALFERVLARVK